MSTDMVVRGNDPPKDTITAAASASDIPINYIFKPPNFRELQLPGANSAMFMFGVNTMVSAYYALDYRKAGSREQDAYFYGVLMNIPPFWTGMLCSNFARSAGRFLWYGIGFMLVALAETMWMTGSGGRTKSAKLPFANLPGFFLKSGFVSYIAVLIANFAHDTGLYLYETLLPSVTSTLEEVQTTTKELQKSVAKVEKKISDIDPEKLAATAGRGAVGGLNPFGK